MIEQEFPHLAKRYRATYAFDDHVSTQYSETLRTKMRAICEHHGVSYGHYGRGGKREVYDEVTAQRFAGEQLSFDWPSS